mmetsp:Transcript_15507/g.39241  ORF Transcript_15507/g.39241 Transcript_15507/m.39241 type:complete len:330 (-) Transcript_15507:1030-2019(-)
MLLPQCHPHPKSEPLGRRQRRPLHVLPVPNHHRHLRVPVAHLGPIVEVRRANQDRLVIHNQDLGVNIDLLDAKIVLKELCPPQGIEADILAWIHPGFLEPAHNTVPPPAHRRQVGVDDGPAGVRSRLRGVVALLPGHHGQHHIHPKRALLFVCHQDAFHNLLRYPVADVAQHAEVAGARCGLLGLGEGVADEKLVLDVEVVLGAGNEVQVGVLDAVLRIQAQGPVSHRPAHLHFAILGHDPILRHHPQQPSGLRPGVRGRARRLPHHRGVLGKVNPRIYTSHPPRQRVGGGEGEPVEVLAALPTVAAGMGPELGEMSAEVRHHGALKAY